MIATLIRDAKVRYETVEDENGRRRQVEIGRLSRNTIHKMAQRRPAPYGTYRRDG